MSWPGVWPFRTGLAEKAGSFGFRGHRLADCSLSAARFGSQSPVCRIAGLRQVKKDAAECQDHLSAPVMVCHAKKLTLSKTGRRILPSRHAVKRLHYLCGNSINLAFHFAIRIDFRYRNQPRVLDECPKVDKKWKIPAWINPAGARRIKNVYSRPMDRCGKQPGV
jgi:hypothetical protein